VGKISSLIVTILLIGILVVAHEFGHFIVAKKSGIWVQEFAVGMGPKLFSRMKGDTEYSLRLLPLGGFCRMAGDTEEDNDPRSYFSKPTGLKLAVMAAGPFMNFLLAFIMIFGLTCTTYTVVPELREVFSDSAAADCSASKDSSTVCSSVGVDIGALPAS
jgi:regulator of sigma E protease